MAGRRPAGAVAIYYIQGLHEQLLLSWKLHSDKPCAAWLRRDTDMLESDLPAWTYLRGSKIFCGC